MLFPHVDVELGERRNSGMFPPSARMMDPLRAQRELKSVLPAPMERGSG